MDIGRITFSIPSRTLDFNLNVNDVLPSPTRPTPPMPECKPSKKEPSGKTAEEMLKKALEFANQGMDDNNDYLLGDSLYAEGKYVAYEDMAAHLEMLIKEAKQNG